MARVSRKCAKAMLIALLIAVIPVGYGLHYAGQYASFSQWTRYLQFRYECYTNKTAVVLDDGKRIAIGMSLSEIEEIAKGQYEAEGLALEMGDESTIVRSVETYGSMDLEDKNFVLIFNCNWILMDGWYYDSERQMISREPISRNAFPPTNGK